MVSKEKKGGRETYGLIGYPLGHSFSAKYFSDKFRKEGIDSSYALYPLQQISDLPGLLRDKPSIGGLNVTIPYKQEVFKYLDEISDDAKEIGAVNVLKIIRGENGGYALKGFNSDYIGFMESIRPLLGKACGALILGTGGASKAVEYALKKLGIKTIKVSRKRSDEAIAYNDLTETIIAEHNVIINSTPLGMSPNVESFPPLPYHFISPSHLCYDLVYNPEITEFMRHSAARGATVKNGLEMLYLQAEAAWRIWNSEE